MKGNTNGVELTLSIEKFSKKERKNLIAKLFIDTLNLQHNKLNKSTLSKFTSATYNTTSFYKELHRDIFNYIKINIKSDDFAKLSFPKNKYFYNKTLNASKFLKKFKAFLNKTMPFIETNIRSVSADYSKEALTKTYIDNVLLFKLEELPFRKIILPLSNDLTIQEMICIKRKILSYLRVEFPQLNKGKYLFIGTSLKESLNVNLVLDLTKMDIKYCSKFQKCVIKKVS